MFTAQVNFGVERLLLANESATRHMVMDFTADNRTVDMKLKDADNLTAFVAIFARKVSTKHTR